MSVQVGRIGPARPTEYLTGTGSSRLRGAGLDHGRAPAPASATGGDGEEEEEEVSRTFYIPRVSLSWAPSCFDAS